MEGSLGVSMPMVGDPEQRGGDAPGMPSTRVQCFNSIGRVFSSSALCFLLWKGVFGINADGRRSRAVGC